MRRVYYVRKQQSSSKNPSPCHFVSLLMTALNVNGDEAALAILLITSESASIGSLCDVVALSAASRAGGCARYPVDVAARAALRALQQIDAHVTFSAGAFDVSRCTSAVSQGVDAFVQLLRHGDVFYECMRRCVKQRCSMKGYMKDAESFQVGDSVLRFARKKRKRDASKSGVTMLVDETISVKLAALCVYDMLHTGSLTGQQDASHLSFDLLRFHLATILISQREWKAEPLARLRKFMLTAPQQTLKTHPDGLPVDQCPPFRQVREPFYAPIILRILSNAIPMSNKINRTTEIPGIFYNYSTNSVAKGLFHPVEATSDNDILTKTIGRIKYISNTTTIPFYFTRLKKEEPVEGVYVPHVHIEQALTQRVQHYTGWVFFTEQMLIENV